MAEYSLPGQKYTEADYLFQTIEMAKSDEEYDVYGSSPPRRTDLQEPSIFSWKMVKRRPLSRRRNTFTHSMGAPPAPPSTPTSLTATSTPTPSPTASSSSSNGIMQANAAAVAAAAEGERLKSLLYILDYAPKYKKKLKEQQRTDAELAALFNVITLTNNGMEGNSVVSNSSSSSSGRIEPLEHRICAASRSIRKSRSNSCAVTRIRRKSANSTKIFKLHRNPKEFFREQEHEEDSVSAPEYDDADERENHAIRYRRHFLLTAARRRRSARFEQQERMEAMMHDFGNGMTFNEI